MYVYDLLKKALLLLSCEACEAKIYRLYYFAVLCSSFTPLFVKLCEDGVKPGGFALQL
jgi:hypothetical protein